MKKLWFLLPLALVSIIFTQRFFALSENTTINTNTSQNATPIPNTIKKLLQGKFQPSNNQAFVNISSQYTIRNPIYLQKETSQALIKMLKAAKKDNIHFYILSGTRNFNTQKNIWEAKFNGVRKVEGENLKLLYPNFTDRSLKILEQSSMPGTSRHHWGTDFDIVISKQDTRLINHVFEEGKGLKVYQWLQKNAFKYGFCQPYKGHPSTRSQPLNRKGYLEEKWHWSYKPLASVYLKKYQTYKESLIPKNFKGEIIAKEFYMQYVSNISQDCL